MASIYTYEVVTTSMAFFLTISLNLLGTGIIVTRLLMHRYRIVRILGTKQGACYTNVAAILMESAALVVVFGFFFAVTFITGGPLFNLASEIIGHIQVGSSVYSWLGASTDTSPQGHWFIPYHLPHPTRKGVFERNRHVRINQ